MPEAIVKIFFLDQSHGWALQRVSSDTKVSTSSYYMLATKDGGNSWTRRSKPLITASQKDEPALVDLAFSDRHRGWIVGGSPYNVALALQTVDEGKTVQKAAEPSAFFAACFGVLANENHVWIYGEGGLLQSADFGHTWSGLSQKEFADKGAVTFSAGLMNQNASVWLAGTSSLVAVVLHSRNSGQDWSVSLRQPEVSGFDLLTSLGRDHVCTVANPSRLFCTADDGQTWSKYPALPAPADHQADFFQRIIILPSGRGWLVRGGGYLYSTADGGKTWHELDPLNPALD